MALKTQFSSSSRKPSKTNRKRAKQIRKKLYNSFVCSFARSFEKFSKFGSRRRDRFGPKIVKFRGILAIFRPFEDFEFETAPNRIRKNFQTTEKSRGWLRFLRFSGQKNRVGATYFLKKMWRRHRWIGWWIDRVRAIDLSRSIDRPIADRSTKLSLLL